MVKLKVALLCIVPDTPFTVTVALTAFGGIFTPQPDSIPRPATLTTSRNMASKLRRFLSPKQKHSAHASAAPPGNSGLEPRSSAADVAVVVTVSCAGELVFPEGVTEAGEKEHVAPAGSPEQLNVTVELNPPCGVSVTVAVPLPPAFTLREEGATAMLKPGGGTNTAVPCNVITAGEFTAVDWKFTASARSPAAVPSAGENARLNSHTDPEAKEAAPPQSFGDPAVITKLPLAG